MSQNHVALSKEKMRTGSKGREDDQSVLQVGWDTVRPDLQGGMEERRG